MGAKGIARDRGLIKVIITMALAIVFIFALAGPVAADDDGKDQPPSGSDPGFCTQVPQGLYDDAVRFAGSVINRWYSEFPDFPDKYPSLDKIREIVYAAAEETGISNSILIEWMVNEAATHSPGGMCFKDPSHPPTYPGNPDDPGRPGDRPPDDGHPGHNPPKNIFKKRFKLLVEPDDYLENKKAIDATLVRVLNLPRKYESHPGKHRGGSSAPGGNDQGGPQGGDRSEPASNNTRGPRKLSGDDGVDDPSGDKPNRGKPHKGGPFDGLQDAGIFLDLKRASKRSKFYDVDGNKVSLEAILEARLVKAKTKLLKMNRWLEDDGDPLPTFRTYKLQIVVPGGVLARRACARYRKARANGKVRKLGKRARKSTCRAWRHKKRKLRQALQP